MMQTYRVLVRVGAVHVWAQTTAQNPNAARLLFDAQYGSGNVIGVPTEVV
jgi:hypothetical protein